MERVLVGKEGYLFLADGGHGVFDYATGRLTVEDASFAHFENNIKQRAAWSASAGAKYLHVVVPDKQSVLSDLSPVPIAIRLGETYLARCRVGEHVMYPRHLLSATKPSAFLKTDTHLTHAGSIALTKAIVGRLTRELPEGERTEIRDELTSPDNFRKQLDFCGDLGAKFPEKMTEPRYNLSKNWKDYWVHNNFIDGNNGVVDIRFNFEPILNHRVLLFGDSFGRDIAWFLSYFFAEVIFMRTPFFHRDIFDQIQPEFVITENAERYLNNCSSDDERPNFFMYPYLAGKPYAPSAEFAAAFSAILSGDRSPYFRFRDEINKRKA